MDSAWKRVAPGVYRVDRKGRPSTAQTTNVAYAFGSPGLVSSCCGSEATPHAGAGQEARIRETFGIGSNLGCLAPDRDVTWGVGLWSVNAAYYFQASGRGRRLRPFVTAGYSMAFRGGRRPPQSVERWSGCRVLAYTALGIRVEIRDHVLPGARQDTLF